MSRDILMIRDAKLEDAERILDIYAYYVKNTAVTFEYDVPALSEFRSRMKNTMEKYPYLVIEKDGVIQGYAYAGAFVGRAAYGWSCELTVYLDHTAQKCGLGRKIYEALESRLKEMGILNLYACIGCPEEEDEYLTKNSADFHEHLGFSKVGEFSKCGYKFGRWYNMIWMEKIIGKHQENQPPVTFPQKRYKFRKIRPEDAQRAAEIEAICFPPDEACTLPIMKERIAAAADCFLAAIDCDNGEMVGFVNGLCTDEEKLRDELFTDTSLHDPNGKNIMICSVAVLPGYRKRGIAREMMREFLRKQQAMGRRQAILTCVPSKVKMYRKFGFSDRGESTSTWGGEKWHEMSCTLNF